MFKNEKIVNNFVMKKLIVFFIVVLVLCAINLNCIKDLTIKKILTGASAQVYVCDKDAEGLNYIKNGEGAIIFCEIKELKQILKNFNVIGFTIKINKSFENEILEEFSPLYTFKCNNYKYGYLQNCIEAVLVNGKYANFQYEVCEDSLYLGFPILLGSY